MIAAGADNRFGPRVSLPGVGQLNTNDAIPIVNSYQSSSQSLSWFRWIVLIALGHTLLVVFLSLSTTFRLINQPYGGFIWSWNNARGRYMVDETYISENSRLKLGDLILSANGLSVPDVNLARQAQSIYASFPSVCDGADPLPTLSYQIEREGQLFQIESPVECLRLAGWLRMTAVLTLISLLLWSIGIITYRANPHRELNLVFTLGAAYAAQIVIKQTYQELGTYTFLSQFLALGTAALANIIFPQVFIHLAAILPIRHPSKTLCQTRLIWYILIPISLLTAAVFRFRLMPYWSPPVGVLDRYTSWALLGWRYVGPLVLFGRCARLNTTSPIARRQARWIRYSLIPILLFIPFQSALLIPELSRWIPFSHTSLLLLAPLGLIGLTYSILRFQIFRGRILSLRILMSLAFAAFIALLVSRIPAEISFATILLVAIALSLFWALPNPARRLLYRIAEPDIVSRQEIEHFNEDIQPQTDLETLSLTIVQSLEKHLGVKFVVLWMVSDDDILTLETYTGSVFAAYLPDDLPLDLVWVNQPASISHSILAKAGCELILPLQVGRKRVGLLGLGPRWTEEVFDESDLSALAVMANQAALALHTACQIHALRQAPMQVEQAQLDERDRIGRDLHDKTQAQLTHLDFALERIRRPLYTDPARAESLLDGCIQDVNEAARQLRDILGQLLSQRVEDRSLLAALADYVAHLQAARPDISFVESIDQELESFLSAKQQKTLLYVCRQALDNAVTHAHPSDICIAVQWDEGQDNVLFSVVDDGVGFAFHSMADMMDKGHFGLFIMASRVKQQGGVLQIRSTPREGTAVTGRLPIKQPGSSL